MKFFTIARQMNRSNVNQFVNNLKGTIVKIYFLMLILIIAINSLALSQKIVDMNLSYISIYSAYIDGDTIILAGYEKEMSGVYQRASVKVINKGKVTELPDNVEYNDIHDIIKISPTSYIVKDKNNNIWLTGKMLYKYDGFKWHAFYINDEYHYLRSYEQIIVGENNDIFFICQYAKNLKEQQSALYKFSDGEFELIYSNPAANSLAFSYKAFTLKQNSDNTISLFEKLEYPDLNDMSKVILNQYVTINNDKSVSKIAIDYINYTERKRGLRLYGIYSDENNRRFFYYDFITWIDEVGKFSRSCCGGMSMLYNNKWTKFDENHGLERAVTPESQDPIIGMSKIDDENYFLLGFGFYIMGQDLILKKLNTESIFENATFIPANANINSTVVDDVFKGFHELAYFRLLPKPIYYINLIDSNQLAIAYQVGILILSINNITSIIETQDTDFVAFYPNPVTSMINIDEVTGEYNYIIYDLSGSIVQEGKINNDTIDVSNLNSGTFIIKLSSADLKIYKKIKFIKIN